MLRVARERDGMCPLCFVNRLLPTPYEYEVDQEPLRSAKELIKAGESYGVVMEGSHSVVETHDHVPWPFRTRPQVPMPNVNPQLFRSTKGSLAEAWWRGESSLLTRLVL